VGAAEESSAMDMKMNSVAILVSRWRPLRSGVQVEKGEHPDRIRTAIRNWVEQDCAVVE
jgi:hypothetical protein